MRIQLNGEAFEFPGETIDELIKQLGFTGKRLAVEHNGEVIPRSEHAGYQLTPGDCVELVQAIGGG